MRKMYCVSRCALVVLLAAAWSSNARAGATFSISTYQEWSDAIGPQGPITPTTSWDQGGFETIFPGQSASFQQPTLTAEPDVSGLAALQLGFGSASSVVGGFTYTYVNGKKENLNGDSISFSIRQTNADQPGTYTVTLYSFTSQGKGKETFTGTIPVQSGNGGFENVTINPLSGGAISGPFDLSMVSQIQLGYKGTSEGSPASMTADFDHFSVVPEPSSIVLGGISALIGLWRLRHHGRRAAAMARKSDH